MSIRYQLKTLTACLFIFCLFFSPDSNAEPNITPAYLILGTDPTERLGASQCAVRTELILDKGSLIGPLAQLTNYLEGNCKILVYANKRITSLQLQEFTCGSSVWRGQYNDSSGRITTIEITDHRFRRCRDFIKSQLIVREISGEQIQTLYALDQNN